MFMIERYARSSSMMMIYVYTHTLLVCENCPSLARNKKRTAVVQRMHTMWSREGDTNEIIEAKCAVAAGLKPTNK